MDQSFARSARTRRPVGRAGGGTRRSACRHIGSSQRWCVMKCHGACLKHKASPTRRVIRCKLSSQKCSKFSAPPCNGHAVQRRSPVSYCPLVCPLYPIAFGPPIAIDHARFSFVRRPSGGRRQRISTQHNRSHIAMSCNLQSLESVANLHTVADLHVRPGS